MATRHGKRYLGNKNKVEVHDLDKKSQCQIGQITTAGYERSIQSRHSVTSSKGYENCEHPIVRFFQNSEV